MSIPVTSMGIYCTVIVRWAVADWLASSSLGHRAVSSTREYVARDEWGPVPLDNPTAVPRLCRRCFEGLRLSVEDPWDKVRQSEPSRLLKPDAQ